MSDTAAPKRSVPATGPLGATALAADTVLLVVTEAAAGAVVAAGAAAPLVAAAVAGVLAAAFVGAVVAPGVAVALPPQRRGWPLPRCPPCRRVRRAVKDADPSVPLRSPPYVATLHSSARSPASVPSPHLFAA